VSLLHSFAGFRVDSTGLAGVHTLNAIEVSFGTKGAQGLVGAAKSSNKQQQAAISIEFGVSVTLSVDGLCTDEEPPIHLK
jgi:hypothetical protein